MTIGRPQGAVWIGKPLDVVIPLTLDAAEAGGALCLEAEVLQGDTRIADRSVTVSLEPGATPGAARMHIRSTVTVDEPVVTVTARAGCEMRSTRSYVLLADVASEITPPAVASATPRALPQTAPAPAPVRRSAAPSQGEGRASTSSAQPSARQGAASAPGARRAAAAPASATAPAQPRRPAAAQTPSSAAVAAPPRQPVAGGARLQLDALEPVPAAQPGLRTTPQLTPPSVEDLARRSEAAAQWRTLNGEAGATRSETQRMQALEATLAALREQTAQNQRTLLALQSELAQARESRYSNPLVYALIVLLLIALLAMALLWRLARRAAAPAWWGEMPTRDRGSRRGPDSTNERFDDDGPASKDRSSARRSANATTFGAASFADAEPEPDSGFDEPDAHLVRTPDGAPARSVNTEELFDVQQQSDFFLSLGQHDQAIAVLREHIATNPQTSALAYLDLLRIFHSLDRRDDYARLAEEFERAFNADVPVFDAFNETGRGLEHYRGALARIESQWPAPGTLALIEELVFRKPGVHEDEAFDLAAYQELLLLYSVAKEVIDPDSAPPAPVTPHSFADTFGHDQLATTPAPLGQKMSSPAVQGGPMLPPAIYDAIDESLPGTGQPGHAPAPSGASAPVRPGLDMDLGEFDKTAFETMPAPIEPPAAPSPSSDPHVIDFELFDPETEADIAPRPVRPVKR